MRSGLVNVFTDHRVPQGQRIDELSVPLLPPLQIGRVLLQPLPPVVLPLLLVDRLLHRAHRLLHRRRHARLLARRSSRRHRRGIPLLETVLLLRFELQLRRLPLHLLQLEPLALLLRGHLLLLLDLLHLLRGEHLRLLLVVHLLLLRVELLLLLGRLLGVALLLRRRLLEGKRLVGQQVVDHRRRRLLACDWLKGCYG